MNYDDIFNQPEEKIEWASFKNVGDRIAGTYIDLEEGEDGFGSEQYVVTLLRDGTKIKYGIRKSHVYLVEQIKKMRLGQLVGFVFKETKPSGKGQPTKVIVPVTNPGMIDEAWTKNYVESMARIGIPAEVALKPEILRGVSVPTTPAATPVTYTTAPATAAPVAAAAPEVDDVLPGPIDNPAFVTVRNLAVGKGVAPATATPAEIDAKIKEVTGFEINEANITQIIVAISALPQN